MFALGEVLDAIARAVLGESDDPAVAIGEVTLRPHQRDALRRVRESIDRSRGALLADEPGLGKTFVALALAQESAAPLVIAPAALRTMWRDASVTAGVSIDFISMEMLSRRDIDVQKACDLVIVDEAHHVCNPATARYARLARLTSYRKVLLLSATPVRNRRAELSALLALFMGPRAHHLDQAALSQCIIRRRGDSSLRPAIDGPHWHRVRAMPRLGEMIENLPPALPALDGREASALLGMTLARCWASSLAALDTALKRRVQRGAALGAILESGRMPTRAELRAWVVGDDAVQLAFPMFVSQTAPDSARLRDVLDAHLVAVRAIRDRIGPSIEADARARAQLLRDLRSAHAGTRIVAFTVYAATAHAIYHALRLERGVVLLTARGARTAGGARPRAEVIEALASGAARSAHDEISLVITTDLLSEGVNLQGASVVVHLDAPWTPAALDQRVGRAARMGSSHAQIHVHGLEPPPAAARLLTLHRRLAQKRAAHADAFSAPAAVEQLRAIAQSWKSAAVDPARNSGRVTVRSDVQVSEDPQRGFANNVVATSQASTDGFIALISRGSSVMLVRGTRRRGLWRVSDAPHDLLESLGEVSAKEVEPHANLERYARQALRRWLARRGARESTGAAATPTLARRELLARIDSLSQRAPAHVRAAIAARTARVRGLIDRAISAGAELALEKLLTLSGADLETLLDSCEIRLADTATISDGSEPPVLRALLLLRRPL